MISRNWWVTHEGRATVGPVSTELLIEGIKAKKVPPDSMVCEVGGSRWQSLGEVADFQEALTVGRRSPPSEAPTVRLPLHSVRANVSRIEDSSASEDHTVVTGPPFRISEPASAPEEPDERTLVDVQRPADADESQS